MTYFAPSPFVGEGDERRRFARVGRGGLGGGAGTAAFLASLAMRVWWERRSVAPGVALCHGGLYAAIFGMWRSRGVRLLAIVQGHELQELHRAGRRGPILRVLASLYRRGLRQCDRVLCVSKDLRNVVLRETGLAEERVSVFPNAIPDLREVASDEMESLRRDLDLGPGAVLGFVGGLQRVKRVEILVEAFALYRRNRPANLLVVGDGPERRRLEQRAQELDVAASTRFVGWQTEPHPYMKLCDLLVLPSEYEGAPLVLLEALGMDVVAVAADVGGVPDIIDERSLRFAPEDPEALCRCLEHHLGDAGAVNSEVRSYWRQRADVFRFDWGRRVLDEIERLAPAC